MSPDELKVATFSGVKVSQCLKSIVYMRGNLYLSAIILFFFLSNAVYPFFILLVKYSCIVNILFTLNSHLFPIFNIPFFILTFFSLFSVVSLVSVVSVAKKSTLYTNEMQPAVFLPVFFSYNHRTLYEVTLAKTAVPFHLPFQYSKSNLAFPYLPLFKPQTLSFKTKVMPSA